MKTEIITNQSPKQNKYPYLAIWYGPDVEDCPVSKLNDVKAEDVVIIYQFACDKSVYVQDILFKNPIYKIGKENEYLRLPSGFKIEITQE
jgi:hypothetical protein